MIVYPTMSRELEDPDVQKSQVARDDGEVDPEEVVGVDAVRDGQDLGLGLRDGVERLLRVPSREEVEVEPAHATRERPDGAVDDGEVRLLQRVCPTSRERGGGAKAGFGAGLGVTGDERAEEAVGAEREVRYVWEDGSRERHGDKRIE